MQAIPQTHPVPRGQGTNMMPSVATTHHPGTAWRCQWSLHKARQLHSGPQIREHVRYMIYVYIHDTFVLKKTILCIPKQIVDLRIHYIDILYHSIICKNDQLTHKICSEAHCRPCSAIPAMDVACCESAKDGIWASNAWARKLLRLQFGSTVPKRML